MDCEQIHAKKSATSILDLYDRLDSRFPLCALIVEEQPNYAAEAHASLILLKNKAIEVAFTMVCLSRGISCLPVDPEKGVRHAFSRHTIDGQGQTTGKLDRTTKKKIAVN